MHTRSDRDVVAVAVYPDDDVNAYSGAPRPKWQEVPADIQRGEVDAIATWHADRLTRSPRELEDVIDLAGRQGVELATRRSTGPSGRRGSGGRLPTLAPARTDSAARMGGIEGPVCAGLSRTSAREAASIRKRFGR
ncbi:hypothetical protein BIV25_36810 [Streptomyces sp. MUSC 14]|nr:hypothetical protein BIV25_36810 [Streptomyces sp. MUSC 14]